MEAALPFYHVQRRDFASTHWETVRACAANDTVGASAREELCRDYWYPVYAWLRRSGQQVGEPEDLTQDFFAYILNRPWFIRADQGKGKFRSFMLGSLDKFLKDKQNRKDAFKRGAGFPHISYDFADGQSRFLGAECLQVSAEESYELDWTTAVVERALKRLQDEYFTTGRATLYDQLRRYLTTVGSNASYEATARTLGVTVENVKVSVCRLRKLYGSALREEVARTVSSPGDIEGEMRHMRAVFSRG